MNPIDEKFFYLMEILDGEWQFFGDNDGVLTERKNLSGSNIACFRSNGLVNADAAGLFDYVLQKYDSFDSMKKYDSEITHYEILEKISEDARVCYQVNSLGWPIWPRDIVYLQTTKKIGDAYWIYMYSVDSQLKPEQPDKYVRAKVTISAYGFIPEGDSTRVYRIAHVEPGGSIPAAIINAYANKTAKIIKELKNNFSSA